MFRDIPYFRIDFERDERPSDFGYVEVQFDVYHLSSICVPEHRLSDWQEWTQQSVGVAT